MEEEDILATLHLNPTLYPLKMHSMIKQGQANGIFNTVHKQIF